MFPVPNEIPLHVADAIKKAEALGNSTVVQAIKRAEMLRQRRVVESAERKRLRDRMRQRSLYHELKGKRGNEKKQKIDQNLNAIDKVGGEAKEPSRLGDDSGASEPSKKNVAVSGTSSTLPVSDTKISKAGCYKYLPYFDKDYFCGYCDCGLTASWHYRLIPAVSFVPMIQMLTNDDNSNYGKESDGDTDVENKVSSVAITSTPFKSITDSSPPTRPAVVTPPEKTAAKPSKSATVQVFIEKGADAVTHNADKVIAKHFNSNDTRAAIFGLEISRPLGDRKLSGKIAVSWYPPKYLPVFGDGSGTKRMRKEDIVGHSNHIIHVGKNIMKQSEWNVDEAEANVFGSSTKYHSLLVHDPNIAATAKAGLSIIYFKPVAMKYFWLSFITTARNARRNKKEERGRGYGRMILWRLIKLAHLADGIEEIYLEVNPEWKTAIGLYRSLQFEEISWDLLPKEIEACEFEVKANEHPECKKIDYESLFKHHGEYKLMRLNLSVFG